MLHKKMSKKTAVLIFFVVALAGLWFIFNVLSIGPGLPPSEAMPKWYIPGGWQRNVQDCTSFFPEISPYCNAGNYSGGKSITVWYFDDESEFLKGEDTLYRYLEDNGDEFRQELNISTELNEEIAGHKADNSWRPAFGPHSFNVTGYESPETSGYFLVYKRPFLKEREDYFIVYYGVRNTTDLTEETPALKKLIAESYYLSNEEGKVDGLMVRDKNGKGNSLLPWF